MSTYAEGTKFHICIPIEESSLQRLSDVAKYVTDLGFVRFQVGDSIFSVADPFEDEVYLSGGHIVIDRLVTKTGEDERYQFETRLKDSLSLAFQK